MRLINVENKIPVSLPAKYFSGFYHPAEFEYQQKKNRLCFIKKFLNAYLKLLLRVLLCCRVCFTSFFRQIVDDGLDCGRLLCNMRFGFTAPQPASLKLSV
jgi:hypothetical protein